MQIQNNSFLLSGCCGDSYFTYTIPQSFGTQINQMTHISVQQIVFPKVFYNIQQSFTFSIIFGQNTYTSTFFPGNITFENIIAKLKFSFNQYGFTIEELYANQFQNSGKLLIYRIDQQSFTITVSDSTYSQFFGNLQQTNDYTYVSQQICNPLKNQIIQIHTDSIYQQIQQSNSVIYSFQLDSSIDYSYYFEQVDTLKNCKRYTQNSIIKIWFTNQDGQNLQFQSNSAFYITFSVFHLKQKFMDYQTNALNRITQILNYFAEKEFKKQNKQIQDMIDQQIKVEQKQQDIDDKDI